ncbi:MAG: hypothetical protein LH613_01500, partial [Chamaesiphon sp.]|nr:hypothetical protein [Chamaesiphon sp.]
HTRTHYFTRITRRNSRRHWLNVNLVRQKFIIAHSIVKGLSYQYNYQHFGFAQCKLSTINCQLLQTSIDWRTLS